MDKKAIIIGAGFAGLSMAALLGKRGWSVTVLEKNSSPGGRGREWQKGGYTFDMGPSWYLMPEVFEKFFSHFGVNREDYYSLKKLDPYYRIFWGPDDLTDIHGERTAIHRIFDDLEDGGAQKLEAYLKESQFKYDTALEQFLYREYRHIFDFFNRTLIFKGLKLNVFQSLDKYVSKFFSSPKLKKILEYAMVFLGNSPSNAPALYSMMSHIDLNLGVWFPSDGMISVVRGLEKLALQQGAEFLYNREVKKLVVEKGVIRKVITQQDEFSGDLIISSADLHHTETALLPEKYRTYSGSYWKKRVLAPSMFILFLGIKKKLPQISHHNLYFAPEWEHHFNQIFKKPCWPENPCYYVSCTSKTDSSAAPAGCENLFILVPIAPGLEDTPAIRTTIEKQVIGHFESLLGESITDHIEVKRTFTVNDFKEDYNAFKGTALGLAHTLNQTAVFRPGHRSKKVKNLYYTGQYCQPGVGVPMALISSVILDNMLKNIKK